MGFQIQNLGKMAYAEALQIMEDLHAKRKQGGDDVILVVEHPAVITRGRKLAGQTLPMQHQIEEQGIAVFDADRGGELTYHGPGQVVVYFIMNINDRFKGVKDMVTSLEAILIAFLLGFDVIAALQDGHPGIWVDDKKIASIGLRISKNVTKHGIALNVCNDMGVYKLFSPCGLQGSVMTNLSEQLGREIDAKEFEEIKLGLAEFFAKQLEATRQSL